MDWTTLIGHVFLFLATIAGFVFQWMREGRRHDWQKEQFKTIVREIQNGNGDKGETQ